MKKHIIILFASAILLSLGTAQAQNTEDDATKDVFNKWNPWDPSPTLNCGDYQWPQPWAPCPEVQVKQKHDHTPIARYRREGWDTVVTNCPGKSMIMLTCTPYIPTQFFNGQYTVDQIPYAPADTSFSMAAWPSRRQQIPIDRDDMYGNMTTLGFPFFFFGQKKEHFYIGDNGIVTFTNNFGTGDYCPWSIPETSTLPWTSSNNNTPGGSSYFDRMHDAIYGIFEDTHAASFGTSFLHGDQGIYYGVIDEYPCRKIIATWKGIPKYSGSATSTTRQTYQMVCYEGSNIIEVHIKKRYCCSSTNGTGSNAFLGIQNVDGGAQHPVSPITDPTTTLWNIEDGAWGAYWPQNKNPFPRVEVDNQAYRFTPQGTVLKDYGWYILNEDGTNDTLGKVDNGVNSYYEDMQGDNEIYANFNDAPCPSLTKCYVRIDEPTKIVFFLKFHNALDSIYDLQDTVFVGVDRSHDINLHAQERPLTDTSLIICAGNTANLQVDWPRYQDTVSTTWRVTRVKNGEETVLSNNLLNISAGTVGDEFVTVPLSLNTANLPALGVANKIDSIYLQISANFSNCSDSFSTFLLQVYPNFDTIIDTTICEGNRFYWSADNQYYSWNTNSDTAVVPLRSVPDCDSIVHLKLTVMGRTHYTDHIVACKPYTWINGQTYYENNSATALEDTIVLPNQWGCDSIVHLDFQMSPLTPIIRSNIDHFTLSNLDVILNDASIGNDSRTWKFPDGSRQTAPTAYYTLPAEYDSAYIKLVAHSPYAGGCLDSTHIVLYLNRENMWIPNAFTPDNSTDNKLFGSISTNTLSEEMFIYNRHGELVYQCEQVDCTWDGKDLKGTPCPQGAYVYIIRYRTVFEPEREHLLRGTVTLIR